ncbi:MAG: hypothetical protein JXJ30_05465 [Halothiobacillaceae bacterium]|nr:hypothetical protein [Halothiobacillaceae bacterium]HER34268.1 hypothetical protein [Halothiobacillaceae bacterium]
MKPILSSLAAALLATIVLSVLMVAKSLMGVMPELNVIQMLAAQMNAGPAMGWAAHFLIGVVGYGLAYALVFRRLPFGGHALRGVLLGVAGWLVMMIVVMPMAGAGLFGMGIGPMAPVATFMLHVIFGLVLGLAYRSFPNGRAQEALA